MGTAAREGLGRLGAAEEGEAGPEDKSEAEEEEEGEEEVEEVSGGASAGVARRRVWTSSEEEAGLGEELRALAAAVAVAEVDPWAEARGE